MLSSSVFNPTTLYAEYSPINNKLYEVTVCVESDRQKQVPVHPLASKRIQQPQLQELQEIQELQELPLQELPELQKLPELVQLPASVNFVNEIEHPYISYSFFRNVLFQPKKHTHCEMGVGIV